MPQLSLYVDEQTMKELREGAKREGMSISKYAVKRLKNKPETDVWPEGYFERTFGSILDFEIPEDPPFEPDEVKPLDFWEENPDVSPR